MSSFITNNYNRRNTRTATLAPMNARFLDSSDEEESEDEETRLEREEQERLLSKQFGEAQESNLGTNNKRKQSHEDDIEAEYSSNAAAKPKKKRLVLTPAIMTSANGLIRIQSEFPRSIRWNAANERNKVQAAAEYSRTLVHAYKSFCYDLFPSMACSDVLTRMETFGSKKEIKEYLQHLRQDACQAHLERTYGKEQAQRIMAELQHGLMEQEGSNEKFGHFEQQGGYEVRRRGPALGDDGDDVVSGDDNGTGNDEVPTVSTTNTSEGGPDAMITAERVSNSRPTEHTTNTTTTTTAAVQEDAFQDSDDELEFVVSAKPAPVNPFANDDSDEEEEEETIMANDTKNAEKSTESDKEALTIMDTKDKAQEVNKDALTTTTAAADTAVSKTADDAKMEDNDDATVVMAGLQTNANQVTHPEESSESKSTNEDPLVKETTTTTTTLHDTPETNDDDDVSEEEELQDSDDDDDKVNVSFQETQQDSPLSYSSSNETATIVPSTMSESQLDTVATAQGEDAQDSQFVATETAVLATAAARDLTLKDETPTQVETPTQLESPGEEMEEVTRAES